MAEGYGTSTRFPSKSLPPIKTCVHCKKQYRPRNNNSKSKFCSHACRTANHAEKHHTNKGPQKCRQCNVDIDTSVLSASSRYCGDVCKSKHKSRTKAYPDSSIPRGTVGAISELAVCVKLMELGWHVFRCQSPNSPFDVVAIRGDLVRKIEVRTGKISDAGTRTWVQLTRPGTTEHAVYYPRNRTVEFYPVENGAPVISKRFYDL